MSKGSGFEVGPNDALSLWQSALEGEAELVDEMERLGWTGGVDAAEDAAGLRPVLLAETVRAWNGKEGA